MLLKYSTSTLCNPAGTPPFAVHLADISQYTPTATGKGHQNPDSSCRLNVGCLLFNSLLPHNPTARSNTPASRYLRRGIRMLHSPPEPRRAAA